MITTQSNSKPKNLHALFLTNMLQSLNAATGGNSRDDLVISLISKKFNIKYNEAKTKFLRYKVDPDFFMIDFLGCKTLWPGLKEVMESVRDNELTSVRSGNGVGKDWLSGRIVLWFMLCFPPAIVITTAPTHRQVKKLLWGEIRGAYKDSNIKLSDMNEVDWKIDDNWYAIGFSSDKKSVENFQGFHSPNFLGIFDEASGLPQTLFDAIEGNLTGAHARLLAIGNPIEASGPFYATFKSKGWNNVHISCMDHPNVINDNNDIPGAVTKKWVEKIENTYGIGSPIHSVKVLGNFPESGDTNVITLKSLMDCNTIKNKDNLLNDGLHMGVDVARYGADYSHIVLVQDGEVVDDISWNGFDLMSTVGRVVSLIEAKNIPADNVHIDVIGVGSGVVDRLRELGHDIDEVNVSGKAERDIDYEELMTGDIKFANRRAELHWICRTLLENRKIIIDESYESIWRDLTAVHYSFNSKGEIIMEPKDNIKKRIGHSPDAGDAFLLALSRSGSKRIQFRGF